MTFKQKIIFIISLAFFQIFYLLSNYTGQYLNSFFLLTCLTAAILCYNLYQPSVRFAMVAAEISSSLPSASSGITRYPIRSPGRERDLL